MSCVSPCRLFRCFKTTAGRGCPSLSPSAARMKASSAPYSSSLVSRKLARLKPVGIARPPLCVLRASQGGDDDDGNPGVGELPEIVHRLTDRPAAVAVLAGRADPLDVIEHDQAGVEGVGRRGDVRQVERRANEGEPVGQVVEGLACPARSLRRARP